MDLCFTDANFLKLASVGYKKDEKWLTVQNLRPIVAVTPQVRGTSAEE
jgi:hypothetical protein